MKITSVIILSLAVSYAVAASINPTSRSLGVGEACNDDPAWCEEGLSCVGNEGNMKCFARKMLGMRCGQDPFWVCEEGLLCEYNVCVNAPISVGGACNDPDDVCEDGLSCVGNEGNMKCFARKMLGMRCGQDPFWVCEEGLLCEYNVCVRAPIGRRGNCNDPDDVCEDGLACIGTETRKKCVALRRVGRSCGNNAFDACQEGLVCDYNICRIAEGDSCNKRRNGCVTGLSCVGGRDNRRCFAKRKLGENCGKDPFWVCEDHLVCKDGKCAEH